MFPPRLILVAVDFSEGSRAALAVAARLARQWSAPLHVVHAQDPLLDSAARTRGMDLPEEAGNELSAFTAAALDGSDLAVTEHVLVGRAADVIRDTAEREGADLIVVGATGMTGPERVVFGSTAEGVVRKAAASVLVVRGGV